MEQRIKKLIKSTKYQETTLRFLNSLNQEFREYSINYLTKQFFKSKDLTTKYIKLLKDEGIIEVSKGNNTSINGKFKRKSNQYRLTIPNKMQFDQDHDIIYTNNTIIHEEPLIPKEELKQSIPNPLTFEESFNDLITSIKEDNIKGDITDFDKQLFKEGIKSFKLFWNVKSDNQFLSYSNEFIIKDLGKMGSFSKYNCLLNSYKKHLKKKMNGKVEQKV
jgi:hypothetical protein